MQIYLEFQKLRFKRAWQDGLGFAKRHLPGSITAFLLSSLALFLLLSSWENENVEREVFSLVINSVAAPMIFVGFAFLIFWFRTPAVIYREQLDQISMYQGVLADQASKRFIADCLAVVFEHGNHIFDVRIEESAYSAWLSQVDAWNAGTLIFIRKHLSYAQAIKFSHATSENKRYTWEISNAHNTELKLLQARLKKVEKMLGDYESFWRTFTNDERRGISKSLFGDTIPITNIDSSQGTESKP